MKKILSPYGRSHTQGVANERSICEKMEQQPPYRKKEIK